MENCCESEEKERTGRLRNGRDTSDGREGRPGLRRGLGGGVGVS